MNGIVLSVGLGIVYLMGWNSANLLLEYQAKVEEEKAQASKDVTVYNKARVLNAFPIGDEN
jgi:hypothetical protein